MADSQTTRILVDRDTRVDLLGSLNLAKTIVGPVALSLEMMAMRSGSSPAQTRIAVIARDVSEKIADLHAEISDLFEESEEGTFHG
jgi:hypothetical protein